MEPEGIGNIAGSAKHVDDDHRIREVLHDLLASSNVRAVAFGGGEANSPLWDGHIIDAIFPLV